MNDEEDDRTGVTPPVDPIEFIPHLQDFVTDAFADALNLTVDEVGLRLIDGTKYWQIAQEELPSLDDVDDVCTSVQEDVVIQAMKMGWVSQAQTDDLKQLLYFELFPAVEMGERLPVETLNSIMEPA